MQPHGIMFHHFHGGEHIESQGSLSAEQLDDILRFIGLENILPAEEWCARALAGTLAMNQVCLTFDDTLKCQFDIALPVLERYGLTGLWFIYTSPLSGQLENLEIFRYFRFKYFDDVEEFYDEFFSMLSETPYAESVKSALDGFAPKSYLSEFPFYTDSDRTFRFLRDQVLGPEKYNHAMNLLIIAKGMNKEETGPLLWLDKENIRYLHSKGHVIGLHTHSHPTALEKLSKTEQAEEYQRNFLHLKDLLGDSPITMAHPANSYNKDTLDVLESLGIRLGFRSNMAAVLNRSAYEFPREDHANVMAKMMSVKR